MKGKMLNEASGMVIWGALPEVLSARGLPSPLVILITCEAVTPACCPLSSKP